jgi:choline monooxygenase
MWVNAGRLPHVLAPAAYFDEGHHAREIERIFLPGWHCVGTADDLPEHGDFMTRELFGVPLLVRNHEGTITAFRNVCAHRHALLTHAPRGRSPRMTCQYHGWEYDGEGAVCKVPDAGCFVPIRRGAERLARHRAARLGKLVFVSLRDDGPGLEETLGERTTRLAREIFSDRYRQIVVRELDHPCNWKIPVENVLESYHVPSLHRNFLADHPDLFKVFAARPAPERPVHELGDRFTEYHDALGADSAPYRMLMRALHPGARFEYVHHHIIFGHTSIVSFLQVVTPVSPTTSHSLIRLFLHRGDDARAWLSRALAPALDRAAGRLIDLVLREDAAVYPDVQRGMTASTQRGVLGSREERVHRFQELVARAAQEPKSPRASSEVAGGGMPGTSPRTK